MITHGTEMTAKPGRVVVVGSNGFIGGAVARKLESDGVAVLRVARQDVDLLAPDAGDRLAGLLLPGDSLVTAAAIAPVRTPAMLRDNMTLMLSLLTAAKSVTLAHVVNIGSDAVYADSATPLTEDSTTAPTTLHGIMHLARELMLRTELNVPIMLMRTTLVYGPGDPHNGYGPNRFRRLAQRGEPLVLFGDGEERRDHVFIDDVAEIVARVLYRRSSGVLNVATGTLASFREIAEAVAGLAGTTVEIRTTPRSHPMPHNGYRPFDVTACRVAFPGFSFCPLREGLARAQCEEAAARA